MIDQTLFRADLHCHSTCSDGTFSPEELIQEAAKAGLQGLAITDHDTIKAYDSALEVARKYNIRLISGVELSCSYKDEIIHVLGYSFDLHNSEIQALCKKHAERRDTRNRIILEKLARHNIYIEENELISFAQDEEHSSQKSIIGRPHIAQAMLKKGYISTISEAFSKYIGNSQPCYASGITTSVEEAIHTIHQAKGKAVLAHPYIYSKQHIRQIKNFPFDGVEAYYSRLPLHREIPWINYAKSKGLMITGGSDFHGKVKADIPLGCSWVNEETFQELESLFLENHSALYRAV
jgi:predicted metal-dependent phosphoesterase TrpH